MKKLIILIIIFSIFLTGCGKYSQNNIIRELENKYNKSNGYKVDGNLSITNNDEVYNYDVEVCFKKDDYYKVTLTNTSNNHTQIILKNNDGVYVLTPALNKSFKFQSEWPYNNSQIYLIDALIKDLKNDKNKKLIRNNNQYTFKTKVNYPNNSKLTNQKIMIDKKFNINKVIVYDNNGVDKMTMIFKKINYSPIFNKKEFSVDSIIDKKNNETTKETSNLEDVIYPLFLPEGTKLSNEEKVKKNNGERVIMNYDGEKSFLLVEETTDVFDEFTVIPTLGEPFQLMDTLGIMTDNSLAWTSGGVDYYIVSDVMSQNELVEVAQSITGIVSMK